MGDAGSDFGQRRQLRGNVDLVFQPRAGARIAQRDQASHAFALLLDELDVYGHSRGGLTSPGGVNRLPACKVVLLKRFPQRLIEGSGRRENLGGGPMDQLVRHAAEKSRHRRRSQHQSVLLIEQQNAVGEVGKELVHRPAADIFSSSTPLDQTLRKAFEQRNLVGWQTIDAPGQGQTPARVAVNVQFVEEQGERVGGLVTLRDASTRARLEDQIDVTTKLAALAKITSGVAHEVKNPLNAMVLQLEILKSKLRDQREEVAPQLNVLSSELQRLDRVVKTFLDFTRPVELHPADLNIESLVHEVFTLAEPQARQNNVELVFDRNGSVPHLRADPDLMKQALLNLVLNGCQAMPSGGQLRVTPRVSSSHFDLEIADQGVGIPPEVQPRIFSLFFSTKPGGTGIGLAMAFRIVQLHNGWMDFSSEVARGTTFRVSLPL